MGRKRHEWEDLRVLGINREPGRCSSFPYPDGEAALAGGPSPYCLSLNGSWSFHWARRPAERPADFFKPGYDYRDWAKIEVPSNMEIAGYGIPIYKNFGYSRSVKNSAFPISTTMTIPSAPISGSLPCRRAGRAGRSSFILPE